MSVQVIDIKKHFRNGVKQHYLVLPNKGYEFSADDIDDLVSDWCESESSGSNTGYSVNWYLVSDQLIINEALESELILIDLKIQGLTRTKEIIEKELGLSSNLF